MVVYGSMLALFAGLRKKEVIELIWGDIDLVNGVIDLRAAATKNKKQRCIGSELFGELT